MLFKERNLGGFIVRKAIKKPIEVQSIHYNHNIILDELLKLLRSNKSEPVRYDESTKTIYIQKERGEIALEYGNWVVYEENTDKSFWAVRKDIFYKTYSRVKETVNTFTKNVYEVEFVEFKSLESRDIIEVLNFLGYRTNSSILSIIQRYELVDEIKTDGYITINTLEGAEKVFVSEIIIKGVEGEFYPVKRENFDKVYTIIE